MRKRPKRREIPFGYFRALAFGSDEELVATFGSLEAAEQVWTAIREEFLERWDLWGMPQAWWRFEPGIPAGLRTGPSAIIFDADAEEWERIEQGRRRHLVAIGIDPAPHRKFRPFGSS